VLSEAVKSLKTLSKFDGPPEWTESTMWVTETRYLKVEGEVGILIDVNQLIKNSKDDRLDTDTLLYGSEITVDELDSLEIAAR